MCDWPEKTKYGTPSTQDCLAADDDKQAYVLSDEDVYCCYWYLKDDPWLVVEKDETSPYKDPETFNTHRCIPLEWLEEENEDDGWKEDPANVYTYEDDVEMEDDTTDLMDVVIDCNNASALAGASLALVMYALY